MDLRNAPPDLILQEQIDRALMRLNTTIPGIVKSFDASNMTATVQPAVKMKTFIDGVVRFRNMPPIVNAPVIFPCVSTAGFAITLPVSPGDPCLIIFSQRAIDNWHDRGGIQPTDTEIGSRHHDLADAFVLLSPLPKPEAFSGVESSGIQIRNRSKDTTVTVKDAEIVIESGDSKIEVKSSGQITITASAKVSVTAPELEVTGDVKSLNGGVQDSIGTMALIREIFNDHDHDETQSVTGKPNQTM